MANRLMPNGSSNRLARRQSVELSEAEPTKAVVGEMHTKVGPSIKWRGPNCLRRPI